MAGKRIAQNVVDEPCNKCGATDKFSKFSDGEREWFACGRAKKVDDKWVYCNGEPTVTDPQPQGGSEQESTPTSTATGARSAKLAELFDKIADSHAELSTYYSELCHEMKA